MKGCNFHDYTQQQPCNITKETKYKEVVFAYYSLGKCTAINAFCKIPYHDPEPTNTCHINITQKLKSNTT
jgi:hypothetical protein